MGVKKRSLMKKTLVTGITGQDGSYLADLLLAKGYDVHGLVRRSSTCNTNRIDHITDEARKPRAKLTLHYGDLSDSSQLTNLIWSIKPDEIYHMGAQSHVLVSFDMPEYTSNITAVGTTRILEAVMRTGAKTRFYQASSGEIFGNAPSPQTELTPLAPCSPYAVAKAYAFWMTKCYREAYGLFATNGVLFSHESPRRGELFVTRKITASVARIKARKQKYLQMGNIDAERDWGYAPEYVQAIWLMLQQDEPDDYVLGTGETHSVKEFLAEAFAYVGLDWQEHVKIDPKLFRPRDVETQTADASKAKRKLGWKPTVRFKDIVKIMVDADMEAVGLKAPGEGKKILIKHKLAPADRALVH
jgi:GDPmannose 4,6-dehydratase